MHTSTSGNAADERRPRVKPNHNPAKSVSAAALSPAAIAADDVTL